MLYLSRHDLRPGIRLRTAKLAKDKRRDSNVKGQERSSEAV